MTDKADRTSDYIGHMLQAVGRIRMYTNNLDQAAFERDIRTQDAVIRNLEILGEAARNVQVHDSAVVAAQPEIPWAMAYRMRNALSHGYADVDLGTVWNTVRNDLPPLERRLFALVSGGE